jgi:glycosyltransferase involved in cell wall biosynthesis
VILGQDRVPPAPPAGTRVLIDVRPLQDADRAPVTAEYLRRLLGAYAAHPLAGESIVPFLQAGMDDPTAGFPGLNVTGRRWLPATRIFRSGALTLDPFFMRGAVLGTRRGVRDSGGAGILAHAVGGAVPIGPALPVVATLLDLAPWELPDQYQRSPAARFGQRLRAQLLRDADAVLVASPTVARAAAHLLHLRPSRIRVVPLAGADDIAPLPPAGSPEGDAARAVLAGELERYGLPERYFVYAGRFDARQDIGTLLRALGNLVAAGRPARLAKAVTWPPRVLLVNVTPDDRASLAREAAAAGVGDCLAYAPGMSHDRTILLVAGARAAILPVLADATGLSALDALASGTPVVAGAVGALRDTVGNAGLLVEPGDPDRLALALRAAWAEERVHAAIASVAATAAAPGRRTWADVAADTRAVYESVVRPTERPEVPPQA